MTMNICSFQKTVEKWGVFELRVVGKADGNPFADYEITAEFVGEKEEKKVSGFYDGNREYVVRFMPEYEGNYSFIVTGSFSEETYSGEFLVTVPGPYTVTQKPMQGDQRLIENFFVSIPDFESDITKDVDALPIMNVDRNYEMDFQDLLYYFAWALVAFMFVEWILQTKKNF